MFEELRRNWLILSAATVGVGVGISGLLSFNSGLFLEGLAHEFGLTRGEFGTCYLFATIGTMLALPLAGWMIDRFGVRWPTAIGAVFFSAFFLCLSVAPLTYPIYLSLMIGLGVSGAICGTTAYTLSVARCFDRARGLALSISQSGVGIAALLVPTTVVAAMTAFGWRSGYIVLAALSALSVPISLLALRSIPRSCRSGGEPGEIGMLIRNPTFWLQGTIFVLMFLPVGGIMVHLAPISRDGGMSAAEAAACAGLLGGSVIASRVLAGLLLDRIHAPWIGTAACAMGACGCALLAFGDVRTIPVAAILMGCTLGIEGDLLGYLTSRYFPLSIYGRAYAWQLSVLQLALGIGSFMMGYSSDYLGSYRPALIGGIILFILVSGLFLLLPRYRGDDASERHSPNEPPQTKRKSWSLV